MTSNITIGKKISCVRVMEQGSEDSTL